MLSILIPTYNDECYELVASLVTQAQSVNGLQYEIIVADDASTDQDAVAKNQQIAQLPCCRLLTFKENQGRAVVRNRLAKASQYDRLLFIDSDMTIVSNHFLADYLASDAEVIYGGYTIVKDSTKQRSNLRYRYELKAEPYHTAQRRNLQPDKDFHTSNFIIERQLFLSHPLDTRFKTYGFEDVLFGKTLTEAGHVITHIDNPVGFSRFETNEEFLNKTEESIRTLLTFSQQLQGYSRLLDTVDKLQCLHLSRLATAIFKPLLKPLRKQLCGNHPNLFVFKLYKIGYLLQLRQQ